MASLRVVASRAVKVCSNVAACGLFYRESGVWCNVRCLVVGDLGAADMLVFGSLGLFAVSAAKYPPERTYHLNHHVESQAGK